MADADRATYADRAAGTDRVVAVLGTGVVPAETPILRGHDLGVLRGDGVFETLHVRDGVPWLLDEHLARMGRSAARLELALPAREALAGLSAEACAAWPAGVEGALRLVCTRGTEDATRGTASAPGAATVFATIGPVGPETRRARHEGVAVVTVPLGVAARWRPAAPWLLGGAKTLSYAVNMASLRHAQSVGAEDVLWVSTDGYALEAPTSTLVWRDGDRLVTVPAEATGILPGTTARYLLDQVAPALGLRADEEMVAPGRLSELDGAWLLSSVRGIAEIRALDGVPLRPALDTARLRDLLGYC
ncbi:MAG TPA: aminotransferase class IV [Micromonosporaceae bacterium]|nr:aminotransferase class IV [Micromonosporaceae bacterium]